MLYFLSLGRIAPYRASCATLARYGLCSSLWNVSSGRWNVSSGLWNGEYIGTKYFLHRDPTIAASGRSNCSIGAQQLRQRGVAIAAKGCSNFHRLTSSLTTTAIGQGVRRQTDKSTGGLHRQFYKKYKLCVISLQTFI